MQQHTTPNERDTTKQQIIGMFQFGLLNEEMYPELAERLRLSSAGQESKRGTITPDIMWPLRDKQTSFFDLTPARKAYVLAFITAQIRKITEGYLVVPQSVHEPASEGVKQLADLAIDILTTSRAKMGNLRALETMNRLVLPDRQNW